MIKQYKTKPFIIQAIKWDGTNFFELKEFVGDGLGYGPDLVIETLEGKMKASIGDYIIKGMLGEFYPCNAEVFEAKYEEV